MKIALYVTDQSGKTAVGSCLLNGVGNGVLLCAVVWVDEPAYLGALQRQKGKTAAEIFVLFLLPLAFGGHLRNLAVDFTA